MCLVKMRSCWIRADPKSKSRCPCEEERTHVGKKAMCGWSEAAEMWLKTKEGWGPWARRRA